MVKVGACAREVKAPRAPWENGARRTVYLGGIEFWGERAPIEDGGGANRLRGQIQ